VQVFASPLTSFKAASGDTTNDPVLLQADAVDYDQPGNMVVAMGRVEITQGPNIVIADQLRYDLANNRVYAKGNVSMLQPSGDVFFADEVELQDDLREGVIRQFGARLADNSLFVASDARKVNENVVELDKASYTPCNCNEDGVPLWQLSADHVELDKEEQHVTYDNAYFKVLGTPVLYTPYFAHATPGADNKSGLLMPSFMRSQNLGTVFQQPVYYSISPDKDITVTPIFQSIAGTVMSGQYRQAFDNGSLLFEGSVTSAQKRDSLGNNIPGNETRGHYKAQGVFHFAEHYNAGFDLRRASDDTYLRLYNFSNDILLTSRAYAEGINFVDGYDRTYASVEGLSFQGLTGQDNRSVIPMVLPLASITHQTNPGFYNSRFRFDGNMMALTREDGNESRRMSGSALWKLPYISEGGQMIEFTTGMRSDVYHVNNVMLGGGRDFDGFQDRQVPQASLSWRYPFINYFESGSLVLEPVVEAYYTPNGNNSSKIPNEDSLFPELTDSNIFSPNRYAGLDRVETGLRTSYGLRAFAQVMEDKYIDMLIGQSWRENDDRTFPYAQDLTSQTSDYVGKIGVTSYPFSLSYRFRLDSDNFSSRRSEVNASVNYYPVSLSTAYLSIQDDPILQTKEVVSASSSINLTRNWSWLTNSAFDVLDDELSAAYTGVAYADECTNLTFMAGKDYTNLQDIQPATTFWVQISLRNLE
jgi:LPS-assembly protein